MNLANEAQSDILRSVITVFEYYQALYNKRPLLKPLPRYSSDTLHWVNLFLEKKEYVEFNSDGSLKCVKQSLPEENLDDIVVLFLENYFAEHLKYTQRHLRGLAILAESRKRAIDAESLNDNEAQNDTVSYITVSRSLTAPRENSKKSPFASLGYSKDRIAITTWASKSYDPLGRKQSTRLRLIDWSKDNFLKSIRLLYNFYKNNPANSYSLESLFKEAELHKFTEGKQHAAKKTVLNHFNTILNKNGFINQSEKLKGIKITPKNFPEDKELLMLLKQYQLTYYKSTPKVLHPESESPQDKPAAAEAISKKDIESYEEKAEHNTSLKC